MSSDNPLVDHDGAAPTSVGAFDIFSSAPEAKKAGMQRFAAHLNEFAQSSLPTRDLLLGIHAAMTPDVTIDTLPSEVRAEMRLSLLILDRPDIDHVVAISQQIHDEEAQKKVHTSWRSYYLTVRKRLADELEKDTKITVAPGLKGALRSLGSRQISGYPEEPVVFASHTLTMAGFGQMMAFQLGTDQIIFPDAYYGLSTGLDKVYTHLCDTYDALTPDSSALTDVLRNEAFLQVLGTRLLHPFWDGNGRGFMGHLGVTLARAGYAVDMGKLQTASMQLGYIGDSIVEKVLHESQLSLVTDLSEAGPLHYLMWVSPSMRLDYMDKLRGGLTHAIDTITDSSSPYYPFLEDTHQTLTQVFLEK